MQIDACFECGAEIDVDAEELVVLLPLRIDQTCIEIFHTKKGNIPEMIQIMMSFIICCGFFIFPFLASSEKVRLRSTFHMNVSCFFFLQSLAPVAFNKPLGFHSFCVFI